MLRIVMKTPGSKNRRTAALLAACTLIGSCATAPPQTSLPADTGSAVLANLIYAKLNADPVYYFRHVDVSVDHGIARLSGYVWSTDAIYGARRIAQSVPGITTVLTTELELERNGRSNGVSR
jgi:osmotically-inducible protein OsmY